MAEGVFKEEGQKAGQLMGSSSMRNAPTPRPLALARRSRRSVIELTNFCCEKERGCCETKDGGIKGQRNGHGVQKRGDREVHRHSVVKAK